MHGFAPREIPLLAAKRRGIVLETSTVIGLIMGLISIFVGMVIKGAPLSALNNPAAFLIIICGTISCLFTGFPMENMKNMFYGCSGITELNLSTFGTLKFIVSQGFEIHKT